MKKKRPKPVRNPLETVMAFNLPKKLKQSIAGRGELLQRSSGQLVRWALEYQEANGWKNLPDAVLDPERQNQLDRWMKEGLYPLQ